MVVVVVVANTSKQSMLTEYRGKGKGISRIKYFKWIDFFAWLSIQGIPFDQYNNFKHFH